MFPDLVPADELRAPSPTHPARGDAGALLPFTDRAERRFWDFFTAHVRNPKHPPSRTSRPSVASPSGRERRGLGLDQVRAGGGRGLSRGAHPRRAHPGPSSSTLAALRMLFDWLVVGQVLPLQPRELGPGTEARRQGRQDPGPLRQGDPDPPRRHRRPRTSWASATRAFLGVLVYSFARVSAAVALRVADYYTQGETQSFFVGLHEKGGRYNVVPAHHVAQGYLDAYLEAARIGEDRRGPLFRSCRARAARCAPGAGGCRA